MSDFGTDELSALTRLKRMREGGYFESEGSVPMPEIVADGDREALRDLVTNRRVPASLKFAQTSLFCTKACQRMTQHGMVATYDTGDPVFHCNICCACHLCCARLAGSERLYEAVNDIGDKLAAWEAEGGTVSSPTFCTECGAMLRCSVCVGDGPGGYCWGCGQKGCAVEGCDAS